MDISLLILVEPPPSYKVGDILDVSLMTNEECTANRCALINVTGIPNKAPPDVLLERIKTMLEAPITVIRRTEMQPARSFTLRRRAWNLKDAPQTAWDDIFENRKITVTWNQVKSFLKKRFVVDELVHSMDEFVTIKDDDL